MVHVRTCGCGSDRMDLVAHFLTRAWRRSTCYCQVSCVEAVGGHNSALSTQVVVVEVDLYTADSVVVMAEASVAEGRISGGLLNVQDILSRYVSNCRRSYEYVRTRELSRRTTRSVERRRSRVAWQRHCGVLLMLRILINTIVEMMYWRMRD